MTNKGQDKVEIKTKKQQKLVKTNKSKAESRPTVGQD